MTQSRLYEVEVTYTIYVVADDAEDAEQTALGHVLDEEPARSGASLVKSADGIDHDWRKAIPYGDAKEDETCVQAFERLKPPEPPYQDPNQVKLPGCDL